MFARLTSVETNVPAGGVSTAWDFAGDGTIRANKLSNMIEILMAFDDMVSPHFCFQVSNAIDWAYPNQGRAKVTFSLRFVKQKMNKSYRCFC
jgi:hypothetical protein